MIFLKKLWLVIFFIFFVGLGSGWYFFFENDQSALVPRYVTQTITEAAQNSRTIAWQTEPSAPAQSIIYYAEKDGEKFTRTVQPTQLSTGAEPVALYTVTLTDLLPGAQYFYKVGSEGAWSRWYSLRTPGEREVKFKAIIFGDSQSENYAVWAQTAQNAWKANPDADFFIQMGDLVDIGAHYDQWKSWLGGAGDMIAEIPVAPISGNHENYLPGGTFTPAYLYKELFSLPSNGAAELEGQSYSFDYGAVHFVVLDTQAEELQVFQPDILARQARWLADDLGKTTKQWKIILMHRPIFKNTHRLELNSIGEVFAPVFDQFNVDLVLSAHIHTYGRSKPLMVSQLKETADGTVYISAGRSGDKTWSGSKRKAVDVAFNDSLVEPNYLVLESQGDKLQLKFFLQDGTAADTYERVKVAQ